MWPGFQADQIKKVIELVKNKPPTLDLILTGRYASKEIIKLADTVQRHSGSQASLQCGHQRPRRNRILKKSVIFFVLEKDGFRF